MVEAMIARLLSSTDREWMEDAACQDSTYDVFFPPATTANGEVSAYDKARSICAQCPVRLSGCLPYVTTHPQDYGMWAGLTPLERKRIRRQQRSTPSL